METLQKRGELVSLEGCRLISAPVVGLRPRCELGLDGMSFFGVRKDKETPPTSAKGEDPINNDFYRLF